jgi:hypothetical protein
MALMSIILKIIFKNTKKMNPNDIIALILIVILIIKIIRNETN